MPIVAGSTTPTPTEFPSEAEWFAAVKAALTVDNAKPYDYGVTIPSSVTAYNLVSVTDRFGGEQRLTGQVGTRAVRITIRAVGKAVDARNPLNNAREMRRRHDACLRENRLTVAGRVTRLVQFETAEAIAQDGDVLTTGSWYSGLTTYTCSI